MKKRLLFVFMSLLIQATLAQVPQGINYQAIAQQNGTVLNNANIDVRFTISSGGLNLYSETHSIATDADGLFVLSIGNGTPLAGTFSGIDWSQGNISIETEMDAGTGFTSMGTANLQSIPYAFYADRAIRVDSQSIVEHLDVNISNIQDEEVLSWDAVNGEWINVAVPSLTYQAGTGIDISGNTITNTGDTDPADDIQIGDPAGGDLGGLYPNPAVVGLQGISVSTTTPQTGQVLKFDGAQWIPATDLVNDADDDPTNEIQVLQLVGQQLSLSGGNTVTLPNGSVYTAGTGIDITSNVISNTGDLNPNDDINVGDLAGGDLSGVYPNPSVSGLNGNPVSNQIPQFNQVLTYNGVQWVPADPLWTSSGSTAIYNQGNVLLQNMTGQNRVELGISNDDGFVNVYDASNTLKAGIRIVGGQGEIFGDVKNFRIPHPQNDQKEIWYASLEGPEAGAYVRGTAQLVDGKAQIIFPEHFQAIATSESMTVLLTPLSAKSKGMAVVHKSTEGFEVVELMEGVGNYAFDWEVKCVRKGHENYQPVRPKNQ